MGDKKSMAVMKKVMAWSGRVITWLLIAVAVFMMIFTIVSSFMFNRNDRNLFGIRFYIVLSDSMSLSENNKDDTVHFNAGDIVLIGNVDDPTALEPGDIIAFVSQNSDSYGETVTHKIRECKTDGSGRLIGYVTYGTNTGKNDAALVEPEFVLGKYMTGIPAVGHFFNFLKTTPGYVVCILIPFLLLILYQGVNTVRLFKRYKAEQMEDMQAERAQIAKEREESAEMLRELQALRAQLAEQMKNPEPTVPSADSDSTNK